MRFVFIFVFLIPHLSYSYYNLGVHFENSLHKGHKTFQSFGFSYGSRFFRWYLNYGENFLETRISRDFKKNIATASFLGFLAGSLSKDTRKAFYGAGWGFLGSAAASVLRKRASSSYWNYQQGRLGLRSYFYPPRSSVGYLFDLSSGWQKEVYSEKDFLKGYYFSDLRIALGLFLDLLVVRFYGQLILNTPFKDYKESFLSGLVGLEFVL